ncbi:MAG: DUF2071 domain-containing protein [Acidobacteria bacterium]|nr:DUF2071 domain-containing protein [Acidobacteriota bacterium]
MHGGLIVQWRLPWLITETWRDLLFAHWPVPAGELRRRLPAGLEPDTYHGQGWISVVPFRMTGIRRRGFPPLPLLSSSLEINVRTYVTVGDCPGVFFFSLDAANPAAVVVGRRWYHLPYFRAQMSLDRDGETIRYSSRRAGAVFQARYRPTGDVFHAAQGSLEHWLVERYCLYAVDPRGRLRRGKVRHAPWPLQPAWAEIEVNTMTEVRGDPLLHFARELEVWIWDLEPLAVQ